MVELERAQTGHVWLPNHFVERVTKVLDTVWPGCRVTVEKHRVGRQYA